MISEHDLVARRSRLSPTMLALLAQRLGGKVEESEKQQTIPRRSGEGPVRLSFAQQRLWFLDLLEPGSTAYNMPTGLRLLGKLNVAALERSFTEVVRRHEVLRTRIESVAGTPVQVVMPAEPVHLPVVDLGKIAVDQREIVVRQMAVEEGQRVFDLSRGGLLRQALLRLGAEEHVLLFTMHHIVSDGWSMEILTREVSTLYAAYAPGHESPLAELPIQYADYAVWQREWLQGEVLEEQLGYWRKQLAGAPAVIELPRDRKRPAPHRAREASVQLQLSAELTTGLKQLNQREGVTLFMTLLAAWQLLLARYSRQADVVVGSPVANRTRSEVEGLIGFFVNTLVLRTKVDGELRIRELLQRVREVCLGAYAHQEVPFEMLVEELQPERNMSHTPLFQVMLNLLNVSNSGNNADRANGKRLDHLRMQSLSSAEGLTAKFDLTLSAQEQNDHLRLSLGYNAELFEEATIGRMLHHLQNSLASMIAGPEQSVSELALMSQSERNQLLIEWNATRQDYPRNACIAELFERQVARTPAALALTWDGQQLSYGELNRKANQLAHYLQRMGVGPETLIAIVLERSLDLVVSMLAVLKAGGAYVPLDPAYPQERLEFMVSDAESVVLLTETSLLKRLAGVRATTVCLDQEWEEIAAAAEQNPISRVDAANLAYVIYTSGSTGQPKGVEISHAALSNLVHWHQQTFEVTAQDRASQLAGVGFDACVWELWPYLTAGASIHLVPDESRLVPAKLHDWLISSGITISFAPTPLAESLLSMSWAAGTNLRVLLTGGDQLRVYGKEDLRCALVNNYGPTENTVVTTSGIVRGPQREGQLPSLGRPIANTEVYLLNAHGQPEPVGVSGELYLGGAGLARGYHNQPKLTAERFVPHPFSAEPGARLYRTGDLARYLPNGEIEFLGRVDEQVKLRGFRIELGEIETVLQQHVAVREAVVIVCEDVAHQKELVGYVVAQDGVTIASSELRQYLRERLPDYMMPSWLVWLAELPLTPNGKIDRRALPAPDKQPVSENQVSPRNTLELKLVQCWEQLFGFGPISVKDNFFDLGGHSLLAVPMVTMAEKSLGRKIPLSLLFQEPTIERIARSLQRQTGPAISETLVELQPGESSQPLFLVHPVGGNVFCYTHLVRHLGPSRAIYAFQAQGLDGENVPHERIETMATQYLEAMLKVQPEGPYFLGGWSMGGAVAFEMAQQLRVRGERVAVLALQDSYAPVYDERRSKDDLMVLKNFALDLGIALDHLDPPDNLRALELDELLARLLEHSIAAEIVDSSFGVKQFRNLFQVFRSNNRAFESYSPRPYQDRIQLFIAGDKSAGVAEAQTKGWSELAGEVETHVIAGDHYTILRNPNVEKLAEELTACLQEAQTPAIMEWTI
jgi:amino acid adenylation domain-containing protein